MSDAQEQINKFDQVEPYLKAFKVSTSSWKRVVHLMHQEIEYGLAKETNPVAALKLLPTFVRSVPDGSEKGDFLALDLGGTNFRVLLVNLQGRKVDLQSKSYVIPQRMMLGVGSELFDYIADCIGMFVHEHNLQSKNLPLGFTFSFPLKVEALAKAKLTHWTKGFRCEGVVGKDVCAMLDESLKRRTDCNVEVVAVVNDTAGTLMSAAHVDHHCEIGLIVATGCNACYMEKLRNVGIWEGDYEQPDQVILNMEWGAFGDNGCLDFLRTEYDRELDTFSVNPSKQMMEKMIGGMYLGEIVRLVMERLTMEGILFDSVNNECDLFERNRFYTKYVSEIEKDSDSDGVYPNTKRILEEVGIKNYTTEDCKIVKYICTLISTRAAYLAASGLAALINRKNKPEMTVGIDGSLYRFHPHFHDLLCQKVTELVTPGLKWKLCPAQDGSGIGAALTAAVSMRVRNTKVGCENPPATSDMPQQIGIKQQS